MQQHVTLEHVVLRSEVLQPVVLQPVGLQPVLLKPVAAPCMYNNTQPRHAAHWPVWGSHWGCSRLHNAAAASTVERIYIPTKMFTYELIRFILIINYETFSHISVRNESTIALLESKLLNMTESMFYMQFKMTWPNMA